MKLQNTVMQLRKVCSHPFLFDWPLDPDTQMPILNDELVNTSGKMMVLDRLLVELFKRRHKVLLFSQFTTMLDIIEVGIFLKLNHG
jgi:ATP-dependent DNA helicase